ncbi:hypothetical protein HF086_002048 [Spodoptera exigua]|uniref:RNA-directed DNA polymerase n=1 Tax=Spodoptera exigua TaxID=7107 RepID=A0A922SHT0_SPOEX|nr:hypothetical protein HF086_002048 [Spodoptera exigua]
METRGRKPRHYPADKDITRNPNEKRINGSFDANKNTGLLMKIAEKIDNISNRLDAVEKLVPVDNDVVTTSSLSSSTTPEAPGYPAGNTSTSIPSIESRAGNVHGVYFFGTTTERPKFSGGQMSPHKFLKQLQRYIKDIRGEDRALDIAIGSLTGPAQRIMELYIDGWKSFEDFKRDLLEVFWGSREQELVKNRLLGSAWNRNGGTTMEEYYAEIVDLVKDLRMPLEESEIVGYIMRHFPQEVQIAWFASNEVRTFKKGIEFLRKLEKNVKMQSTVDRPQYKDNNHRYVRRPYPVRVEKQATAQNYRMRQANNIQFVRENKNDEATDSTIGTEKEVVVIPKVLQEEVVKTIHEEAGHFGLLKIKRLVSDRFYFKGLAKEVKDVLRRCDLCQKAKHPNETTVGPCKAVTATEVGEIVMVDWYGPLPSGKYGMQYILVVQDSFSKFVNLYALRKATTNSALASVRKYLDKINIQRILTDNGRQFTSRRWYDTLNRMGIQVSHTSVRNPRPNSTERVNKELGRLFRTYCHKSHRGWVDILANIEKCYNNTVHSSTGFTPCQIVRGESPSLAIDNALGGVLLDSTELDINKIRQQARENIRRSAQRRCEQYDKGHRLITFHVGDYVKVKKSNKSDAGSKVTKKFSLLYDGPFLVGGIPHPNAYLLVQPETGRVVGTYNAIHIERYYMNERKKACT